MLNGFGDVVEIECICIGLEVEFGVWVVYDGVDLLWGEVVCGMIDCVVVMMGCIDILVNNVGI